MGVFDTLGLKSRPADAPAEAPEPAAPPQHTQADGVPPDPDFSEGPDGSPAAVKHPCEECGNDVQYSGRGRVPAKCPDCKANRSSRGGSTGAVRVPAGMSKRKAKIAGNMQEIAGLLGGSIGMAMPVTGGTIMYTSPPAITGLLDIAEKYPRMLDALEKLTEVMPWYGVGRFVGAVAYAAAVDAGRVNPYGMVGEALGVAQVAEQVGYQPPVPPDPEDDVPQPDVSGEMQVASPARFRMPAGV